MKLSCFLMLTALLCLLNCGRGYSEGDRNGTLIKLSNKGLMWKSWEGELLLGGAKRTDQGTVANTWAFTIVDPALVQAAQKFQSTGEPVTVHYIQWVQSGCSMDTDYEVVAISSKPVEK
jgi:hypothetical protein